jgi:uncharacterized protein (DUF58 family)
MDRDMLSQEILGKVKRIQFKINRLSNDLIAGQYASVFKGSGIEFDTVREYYPGDDVRAIDWNVTARTGRPFLKRYVEERELTVILAVDLSASQFFGTQGALKSELAAEISALLAFLAIKNNDKVGLLIFSDHCEKYVPPQKGRRHVLRVIREILGYQPHGTGTDIGNALDFINRVTSHRGIVFLISDFWDDRYQKALRLTAMRHDLIAILLHDRREIELPPVGLIRLVDRESGREVLLDTSDPAVRSRLKRNAMEHRERTTKTLRAEKVDLLEIETGQSYLEPLQQFFRKRELRIR